MKPTARHLLLLAALLAAGPARADGFLASRHGLSTLVGLGWEATLPQGSTRDFIDRTSFRGGRLDLSFGVVSGLSLGLTGSWAWVTQSAALGTLPLAAGAVTGPAYNRAHLLDGLLTATWYMGRGPLQPYLGVGLGGGWHGTYRAVASVAREESGWHGSAAARAGLLWTVRPGFGIDLQVRPTFSNARLGESTRASWLSIGLGLAAY